jgi:hypothetical protein
MSGSDDERDYAREAADQIGVPLRSERGYTGFWGFLDTWWAPIWLAAGILIVVGGALIVSDWLQT